jgi:hypothetical protein
MANLEIAPAAGDEGVVTNPLPALLTGAGAITVAFLISWAAPGSLEAVRLPLLAVGVLGLGAAVAIRPRDALILGGAGLGALLASLERQDAGWDSGMLLLRVLALVAGAVAILILLPQAARRALVSLFIVFHFCGILTAVTSASSAWLPQQMWNYIYRPYLQFMYLNNAYHFYSPDPGPAPLMWFHIDYAHDEHGKHYSRWVKIPDNSDPDGTMRRPDGTPLWPKVEYTRRLSLAESTNFPGQVTMNTDLLQALRLDKKDSIPVHPSMSFGEQYREPGDLSKRWLRSYIRYVARNYKHPERPDLDVIGIKVYKVIHQIMVPRQIVEKNMDPNDVTLYFPFYMGEFDKDGDWKADCLKFSYNTDGTAKIEHRDPLLYWLIPIMEVPRGRPPEPQKPELRDYLSIHAGEPEWSWLPKSAGGEG